MSDGAPRPYTLVAELTYRCPLRCVYCSNPLDYASHRDALGTADWLRVFREAEALGVVQLNLTGGEPLRPRRSRGDGGGRARARPLHQPDHERHPVHARAAGAAAGPRSRQRAGVGAGRRGPRNRTVSPASGRFERKLEVARLVKELGLPLTLNVVLHRENLDRVPEIIALAESLHADRLELANTQYLGWALVNRRALLPTREQLDRARDVARAARQRLLGRMEVLFVIPDYYAEFPKSCMDGWGRRFIVITPDGLVLPCHAAHTLPGLTFDRVQDRSLDEIWHHSEAFNAYRGEAWMPEPCRSCDTADRRLRRLPLPGVPPDRQRRCDGSGLLARAGSRADRGGAPRGADAEPGPSSSTGARDRPRRRDATGGRQHLDPPRARGRRGDRGGRARRRPAAPGGGGQQPARFAGSGSIWPSGSSSLASSKS